ncbi:DUF4231 domain-containing protein [Desemzia incerta]|uniref:DUF4231 domain-containing protein n=1 Tax=Desemzia incerta TaxID=82801 RepID=UPI003CFCC9AE
MNNNQAYNLNDLESTKEKDYLQERVDDQINWYDKKSGKMQKKYKFLKRITIISSGLIPIISLSNLQFRYISTELIVSSLGTLIAITESFSALSKYNENWTRYRNICETLKSEKYMYLNQSGVYSEKNDVFAYFVERIETIISQENINWASLNKESKKEG